MFRKVRARRLKRIAMGEAEFYSVSRSPAEIRDCQLMAFNDLWSGFAAQVPFFEALVRAGKAPKQFRSWDEFRDRVPIMERTLIQQSGRDLQDRSRPPNFVRTTGGSTSQPLQLPSWHSELEYANADVWFARSWFGINPEDKLFLLWGHSHQLGRGWKGKLNWKRRELKDWLLGYLRWSAYDLSGEALWRAADAMLKFRPAYVMAYAVALDRFGRANADRASEFRSLGLKAAIATAEAFPTAESAHFVAGILGSPVAMEYGSVECGPIAHQRPDGPFQIFWRHWMVEGLLSEQIPGAFEIVVTTLYPRCLPLVRYRIGDLISADPNAAQFDQTFGRVIGRCNDCVLLADGRALHSEAFSHVVKECPFVLNFQVVQKAAGDIDFTYVRAPHLEADETEIRRRLGIIDPLLAGVSIRQVASIPQTVAGKTRTIVSEKANGR
jgi:phenylacetate-CoA ligase